jgi:pilus assembly protein Flp/PilA
MLTQLYCFLSTFRADRKGITALEYALMGALIAVAIVTAATGLGSKISSEFNNIAAKLS